MVWEFAGIAVDVETRERAIEELKKFGYNDLKPDDVTFRIELLPHVNSSNIQDWIDKCAELENENNRLKRELAKR